jgi:hypothetical protein
MTDGAKEFADSLKADPETAYALFTLDGEQITEWLQPDEDGELTFDFSSDVEEFEIGMRLGDGTVLFGEHTQIIELDED